MMFEGYQNRFALLIQKFTTYEIISFMTECSNISFKYTRYRLNVSVVRRKFHVMEGGMEVLIPRNTTT